MAHYLFLTFKTNFGRDMKALEVGLNSLADMFRYENISSRKNPMILVVCLSGKFWFGSGKTILG